MSPVAQVCSVLTFPFDCARKLTIPMFTAESWSRWVAAANPLGIGVFLVFTQEGTNYLVEDLRLIGTILGLGVVFSVLIWCTSTRSVLPEYHFLLVLGGFVMSVLWICTVCSVLVELLSLVGLVLHLSPALLGITFLAWGNSAGDYSANPAVAKVGLEEAAITACFAGPLFNMLVGLGVALMISSFNKPVSFPLYEHSSVLLTLLFLVGSNVLSLVTILLTKGRFLRLQAGLLFALYCGFFLTLLLV